MKNEQAYIHLMRSLNTEKRDYLTDPLENIESCRKFLFQNFLFDANVDDLFLFKMQHLRHLLKKISRNRKYIYLLDDFYQKYKNNELLSIDGISKNENKYLSIEDPFRTYIQSFYNHYTQNKEL